MMKQTILLFTIILYSLAGFSQWQPFYTDVKNYYEIKGYNSHPNDTTIHQFHFDTIIDYGSFKVMHTNYTDTNFNGCYPAINQDNTLQMSLNKQYIHPDSVILQNDSVYFLFSIAYNYTTTTVLFLPQSQPNDVWESPINNSSNYNKLVFTCDSVSYGNVINNINDSLKYFSVKAYQNSTPIASNYDSVTIVLSKHYGFKQLIVFADNNQQNFSTIGIDSAGTKTGFYYPDFSDYFHLSVGDVIIWKEHQPFAGPNSLSYTIYHKDSLTSSLITTDSVIYVFDRTTTGTGGYVSTYTQKNYRTGFTGLESASNIYIMAKSASREGYFWLDELFRTSGAFITNDTIVNRLYYFQGENIHTSNCFVHFMMDVGVDVTYNTYYGLAAHNVYSWSNTYHSIVGSTIDGVQLGMQWSNIIANVDEVEMKNQIHVYPNPSNDGNITIVHQGISQIEIFSMEGKLMLSKNVSDKNEFTGINLPKGFYFIQLLDKNNQLSTKKVVVTGN